MPRVLFLVGRRSDVSVRFRVEQWRPHLRERGFDSDVVELAGQSGFEPRSTFRAASRASAVIVHRALLGRLELARLRLSTRRYVFDFDDALMVNDPSHAERASPERERRVARMVRGAATVIAGNRHLAEQASRWNANVTVVPTTIDLAALPSPTTHVPEPETIGWIGTQPNLFYLDAVGGALARLAAHSGARLAVVCDAPPPPLGIPTSYRPWSLAGEAADLASFAVGIMPLADDAWTRGKCGLKILQYFAAARPVVCSPVGANLDIVEHGRNGYFATDEDEWVSRLGELLADHEKRRRMGEAGRRTVEARYSTCGNLGAFIAALGLAA